MSRPAFSSSFDDSVFTRRTEPFRPSCCFVLSSIVMALGGWLSVTLFWERATSTKDNEDTRSNHLIANVAEIRFIAPPFPHDNARTTLLPGG
jgi:hypothetical protein